MSFLDFIINPKSKRSFEERVLITSLIAALLICSTQLVVVSRFGFQTSVNVITFAATIMVAVLLWLSIEGKALGFVKNTFIFAFPLITAFSWFYKEGIYGSVPALILVNSFISILIANKNRFLITSLFASEFLILLGIQIANPELITLYPTPGAKFYCLITSYTSVGLLLGIVMVMFKKTYEAERTQVLNDKATIDAQNQKTQELNKELEQLLEQKDKFLSIISHDSRAPIKNIGGLLELLNEKEISIEEFKSFLPSLTENIKETSTFMDNLLMYAKSQKKLIKPNQQLADITSIIDGIMKLYHLSASEKNISLKYENQISELVKVDEDMLQIIMRNLIQNSLKFTPKNGSIDIVSRFENNNLVFSLKDSGVGMSTNKMSELFAHENSGNEHVTSKGLGLKLVQDFVKLQNGKIHVKSTPGKGSEFLVEIPSLN